MLFTTTVLLLDINYKLFVSSKTGNQNDATSISDILSIIALIVSILSIIVTYLAIYKSKIVEIKHSAFERIGIESTNKMFDSVDEIFTSKGQDLLSTCLNDITNLFTDIDLYLTSFKDIYKDIDIDKIIKIREEFTDLLYVNANSDVNSFKGDYFATKNKMITELYVYALKNSRPTFRSLFTNN